MLAPMSLHVTVRILLITKVWNNIAILTKIWSFHSFSVGGDGFSDEDDARPYSESEGEDDDINYTEMG